MEHVQVLIVGGGMAGMSAAIWCDRLGLSAVLLEQSQQLGGQLLQIHNEIWDFPPCVYPNGTALLKELLGHRTLHSFDIRLGEKLLAVDARNRQVKTNKATYQTDFLIVATGVRPNTIPALESCGQVLVPWFSTTAQGETVSGQDVAIVGGGDRAVESACNLAPYARNIYLLVRRNSFRARPQWVERLNSCSNVQVLFETEIAACTEQDGKAVLVLRSSLPETPATLAVHWVLPRIGVRGNSEGLDGLATYGDGYVVTDVCQATASGWIYAIGDVTNGAAYASLSLAAGQAMKAVKHISLQAKES
ncbi:NAD(P)/FAD-dependent oxidoreductase [Brevibacillus sp. H7]|uniref:NAD(P)/FAD-dependent oxidoreductase n=1 Tax=Brevibacillus sp. H7 TaxID=3349138 RepID=UPI003826772C